MKKYFPLLVATAFCFGNCYGQGGEWVWMHGSNTTISPGNFGTQGVPSPSNDPPALYEPCEWTDLSGNFWMFGGFQFQADLWMYNPASNEWTWVKGPGVSNSPGYYGIQGVSSPLNYPPSRCASVSWIDNQGNFWMFGGTFGYSDLWKYDLSINEWTWMKGPATIGNVAIYGTQGVPSVLNNPSGRWETAAAWADSNDNLWMFGGTNGNTVGSDYYNDLWRYTISTNEWTWMKGSSSANQTGIYGIQSIEDPANNPGSRIVYSHWKDLTGMFWMYGGMHYYQGIVYDDVWRFNPSTNNWAWMNGTVFGNTSAQYGSLCSVSAAATPGSRWENRACWTLSNGNFLTLGGVPSLQYSFKNNDLWMYDANNSRWVWISGDNVSNPVGNWGAQGVYSPTNKLCGRMGSIGWSDQSCHLYLFGGFGNYNDLWKFTFDTACIVCSQTIQTLFTAPNHICPGTCINFTNLSFNATSYQWSFSGATPPISTDVNPINICYATTGNYDVRLIASNANGSDTLLLTNYITVYPSPSPQSITQVGDTLFAITGSAAYQWYFNGNLISGATDYFYVAPASGDYNVVATDGNGCEVEAAVFNVTASLESTVHSPQLTVFPNPVKNEITIHNAQVTSETTVEISVYNMLGEKVLAVSLPTTHCPLRTCNVDCRLLPPGIYFIELTSGSKTFRTKFVKQ